MAAFEHDDSHLHDAQRARERLKQNDTPELRQQIIESIRGRHDVWRCVFEHDPDMWQRIARAEVVSIARWSGEDYKQEPHPALLRQIGRTAHILGLRDAWVETWKEMGLAAEAEEAFANVRAKYREDEDGWAPFDPERLERERKEREGKCPGCDKPANAKKHRFSCTVHGKNQVVVSAVFPENER